MLPARGIKSMTNDRFFLGLLAAILAVTMTLPEAENPAALSLSNRLADENATVSGQKAPSPASDASKILPRKIVNSALPDFAAIHDVNEKKQQFFDFMLPMIRESNRKIREDRRFLFRVRDDLRSGDSLENETMARFSGLIKRYRVQRDSSLLQQVNDLLVKVDVVPESLVLAQSANESGWGTSRFAREANNMFGVWCFRPGCGLTPLDRDEGLTHEVARYNTIQDSVNAYTHTINTNPAYTHLRDIRAASRAGDQTMSGLALAEGLVRYSERGMDYVREIQQMIRVNNLHEYNFS